MAETLKYPGRSEARIARIIEQRKKLLTHGGMLPEASTPPQTYYFRSVVEGKRVKTPYTEGGTHEDRDIKKDTEIGERRKDIQKRTKAHIDLMQQRLVGLQRERLESQLAILQPEVTHLASLSGQRLVRPGVLEPYQAERDHIQAQLEALNGKGKRTYSRRGEPKVEQSRGREDQRYTPVVLTELSPIDDKLLGTFNNGKSLEVDPEEASVVALLELMVGKGVHDHITKEAIGEELSMIHSAIFRAFSRVREILLSDPDLQIDLLNTRNTKLTKGNVPGYYYFGSSDPKDKESA